MTDPGRLTRFIACSDKLFNVYTMAQSESNFLCRALRSSLVTPTKISRLIVGVLAGKKTICNCLAITDEVLRMLQRGLIHFRRHVSLPKILFFPLSADAGQNEVHYRILLRLISSFAHPSYIDVMCRHKCELRDVWSLFSA